ncbi:MAG: DUF134 domain-containing protein [Oligoflexia bacterium]|nr:DUF134 domain-containing protein [Oligoflexia bacterium]
MRPKKCRHICCEIDANYFKPRGIPLSELESVILYADELQALKLSDLDCLYQADAANKMKISRQTFGRIIESARKKVVDALVNNKAIKIEPSVAEPVETAKELE